MYAILFLFHSKKKRQFIYADHKSFVHMLAQPLFLYIYIYQRKGTLEKGKIFLKQVPNLYIARDKSKSYIV